MDRGREESLTTVKSCVLDDGLSDRFFAGEDEEENEGEIQSEMSVDSG
jgi:hypothetical protein